MSAFAGTPVRDIPLLCGTYGADLGGMLRTWDPGWSTFDNERRLTRIFDLA